MGRKTNNDRDAIIIRLRASGLTGDKIAEQVGMSISGVYSVLKRNGVKTCRQETRLQASVKKLRLDGLCSAEIAKALNKPAKTINQTANAIGMPFTEDEKRQSIEIGHQKTLKKQHNAAAEKAREYIGEHFPDWEYVSGFIHSDGMMELRHKACQTIVLKSAITIRRSGRNIRCDVCHQIEQDLRNKAQQEQKNKLEKERIRNRDVRFWCQEFQQEVITFKRCKECGSYYVGTGKYCSDNCRKRCLNHKRDHRLDKVSQVVSDITLRKLYNRDKGICWICGGKCNYNDHTKDAVGNFIVGKTYPSIDHVYPISKGGSHTWDNVRLAHWWCNTLKSDKVVS